MGDFFALAGQTFSSCGYSFLPVTFKKSSRAGVKPAPTLLNTALFVVGVRTSARSSTALGRDLHSG